MHHYKQARYKKTSKQILGCITHLVHHYPASVWWLCLSQHHTLLMVSCYRPLEGQYNYYREKYCQIKKCGAQPKRKHREINMRELQRTVKYFAVIMSLKRETHARLQHAIGMRLIITTDR